MAQVTQWKTEPAHRGRRNYSERPLLVYWEMTQACGLVCRHCRAEAMPRPHPLELNPEESRRLLWQIASFGQPLPHLILTGGDPLQRSDLYELIDQATALGLDVSITPSATQNLTRGVMAQLKEHRIQSLGLSLDGSTAELHDGIRGVAGCYDTTLRAAHLASEHDLPIQVNTLVSEETVADLPATFELLKTVRVMRWSLFFLIAVGRGKVLREISPARGEEVMHWVYDVAKVAPFAIKTTEAPSYRRIALNCMRREGLSPEAIRQTSVYHGFGIRDGHGIVFVSNTGDIYPAGFLPLRIGNVRQDELAAVYRSAPIMRSLHNPSEFQGKCGRCEHRMICGGSRARAFAYTGDALESDPFCLYEPSEPLASSR